MMEGLSRSGLEEADTAFRQRREQNIKTRRSIPYFSNVGIIAGEPITLGTVETDDCYMVGPAMYSPGFLLAAGTYNKTITLSVSFFQSTLSRNLVARFIDAMITDLYNYIKM